MGFSLKFVCKIASNEAKPYLRLFALIFGLSDDYLLIG